MDEERDRELELEALEERYSDCHWDDLMFMLGDGEKEIKQLKEESESVTDRICTLETQLVKMRELFKDTCWIPYDPYGDGGGGRMCKFCHEREKYPHEKWCKFDKLMGKNHD